MLSNVNNYEIKALIVSNWKTLIKNIQKALNRHNSSDNIRITHKLTRKNLCWLLLEISTNEIVAAFSNMDAD